jgi:predicted nucleic acid-binding protein
MRMSELALLDTNILVYSHQSLSKFHAQSRNLVRGGLRGDIAVCICPQVLMELFSVITNAKRVTNPVDSKKAAVEIEKYLQTESMLKILSREDTIDVTIDLLKKYGAKGAEIYDLQLVATMLSNNVARLYTYNLNDFAKFKEVEALTP